MKDFLLLSLRVRFLLLSLRARRAWQSHASRNVVARFIGHSSPLMGEDKGGGD